MNIISISTDRNILKEGSAARARQIEYGNLFSQTHIILFSRRHISGVSDNQASYQISSNVWVYPTRSRSRLMYISDAVRIAREIVEKCGYSPRDTVVTTQDPFETGLVGARLKKSLGLPLHVQIHTDFLSPFFARHSLVNRIRVLLSRRVLPHAQGIRVVSQRVADSIKEYIPRLGVTPYVLPIFVDADHIERAPVVTDLHKKYPQFSFIVLLAGRMTTEKNIGLGLDACADIIKKYPDKKIGVVVVGEGPEKNTLHARAESLCMAQSVVWEPWTEDMLSYYKTADLFLLPSWYEGYGLALVEAALSRCSVIATDVGVVRDLLPPECVVAVGNSRAFIETVRAHVGTRFGGAAGSQEEVYARAKALVVGSKEQYLARYKHSLSLI